MRHSIFAALLLVAAGCGNRNDSIVVVTLSSPSPVDIASVQAQATAGGKTRNFTLTPPGGSATTPLTFGIDVPYSIDGMISVHVDAFDGAGGSLGSGDGATTIKAGGRADIEIALGGGSNDEDMATSELPDMMPAPPDLETPGMLTIDTGLQPFGPVTQGKMSAAAQFAISNSGSVPTGMPMLTPTGDTADFQISTDCGASVMPMQRCHVTVVFAPSASTATGAKDLKFTLSASPGGSVMGEATGTSLTPGQITVNMPDTGSCGMSLVGTASPTKAMFTVHNGGATATGNLTVMLSDTAQFSSTGCAGAPLAAGGNCTLTVSFTPNKRGSSVSSILISDGPNDQATASVTGVGQVAAMVAISPSPFAFPGGPRNSAAQTQTFTISNSGDLPTAALAAPSTTNSAFAVTATTCTGVQLLATPCTADVRFTPPVTGVTTGQLVIKDNGSTQLATDNLSGTGTPIWVREYTSSTQTDLQAVWATPDGMGHDLAWAVGDNAVIVGRAIDGTWSAQTAVNSNGDQFVAVMGSGPTDLWAIDTTSSFIYRSTGDGTWRNNTTFAPSGVTALHDVYVFSAGDVWVSGEESSGTLGSPNYYAYKFNPTGNNFTSEEADGCRRFWGTSDTTLFCSYNLIRNGTGTSGLRMRGTPGAAWPPAGAQISTGTIPVYNYSTSITGTSATDVYVGVADNGSANQRPYHWNGSALVAVSTSAQHGAMAVWEADSTHVYFGGSYGVQVGNGSTWGTAVDPLGKALSVVDIFGLSVNDVYVVGHDNDGMCVYHYF